MPQDCSDCCEVEVPGLCSCVNCDNGTQCCYTAEWTGVTDTTDVECCDCTLFNNIFHMTIDTPAVCTWKVASLCNTDNPFFKCNYDFVTTANLKELKFQFVQVALDIVARLTLVWSTVIAKQNNIVWEKIVGTTTSKPNCNTFDDTLTKVSGTTICDGMDTVRIRAVQQAISSCFQAAPTPPTVVTCESQDVELGGNVFCYQAEVLNDDLQLENRMTCCEVAPSQCEIVVPSHSLGSTPPKDCEDRYIGTFLLDPEVIPSKECRLSFTFCCYHLDPPGFTNNCTITGYFWALEFLIGTQGKLDVRLTFIARGAAPVVENLQFWEASDVVDTGICTGTGITLTYTGSSITGGSCGCFFAEPGPNITLNIIP